VESDLTEETNFSSIIAASARETHDFLEHARFPSHRLVVSPEDKIELGLLKKGISRYSELEEAIQAAARGSSTGKALIVTDMRAHMNPTRMACLEKLSGKLARRLTSLCPACGAPGWGGRRRHERASLRVLRGSNRTRRPRNLWLFLVRNSRKETARRWEGVCGRGPMSALQSLNNQRIRRQKNMKEIGAPKLLVSIVMGSDSDWPVMQVAAKILNEFDVPYETRVVSAHRTPDLLFEYASTARARDIAAIIAGAGGAAHLPGMLAAKTSVPVLGVPMPSKHLHGLDSLLSIVQMPKGVPVATFAIGEAGAANAALFAIAMLAASGDDFGRELFGKLDDFRQHQRDKIMAIQLSKSK